MVLISSRKRVPQKDSKDDYDEIEKLLGISRDDSASSKETQEPAKQTAEKNTKNDDLIKLLEVDEGKSNQPTQAQETPVEDKRITRMQDQIDGLKKDLKKKDMEIADLKAQLMMKEESSAQKSVEQDRTYGFTSKTPAGSAGDENASQGYKSEYERGLALFNNHQYPQALSVFEQLLAEDTNNDYSDNAQYWMGECYYAMGRYHEAIMAFEKVFTFRYSNKNDYAQFKIGQSYFMLGDKQRARQEFQQLLDNYPKSPLIPRAKEYLAQL
ncbi:MAG: tetratricopeptide repeat protein [Calditrichia bacterium]